jgi:GH24 family phage-related lysozyme (muramidase)
MRQLRSCVANFAATSLNGVRAGALRAMVNQLHTMGDRLWPNDEEGLKTRRYAEAALIEAVAVALDPTTP